MSADQTGFWQTLDGALQGGQPALLAIVAEHTDHSPGTTGARMLVLPGGETVGTIGGGIMEYDLQQQAAQWLEADHPGAEIRTLFHRSSGPGDKSGLICAGSQTNLTYLCHTAADRQAVSTAAALSAGDRPGLLRIGPGGMSAEVTSGEPVAPRFRLHRPPDRDGAGWAYEEQLLNFRRIAIIGAGHCSLALSQVMRQLGYTITVIAAADEQAKVAGQPHARHVRPVDDYRDAGACIDYPGLTRVVIMTARVATDIRALLGVQGRDFPFVGVMGSAAKIAAIMQALDGPGAAASGLPNLRAPVGLPIGSHTPEEIAISIAAQILAEEAGANPQPALAAAGEEIAV